MSFNHQPLHFMADERRIERITDEADSVGYGYRDNLGERFHPPFSSSPLVRSDGKNIVLKR